MCDIGFASDGRIPGEMDCEGLSRNLFDGDVIVMVTDGD